MDFEQYSEFVIQEIQKNFKCTIFYMFENRKELIRIDFNCMSGFKYMLDIKDTYYRTLFQLKGNKDEYLLRQEAMFIIIRRLEESFLNYTIRKI